MRVVVDVTPLSIQPTGIGNYLRGMVGGLASVDDVETVAFSVAGPRGKRRIEAALDGSAVERRLVLVPPSSHTWRTAWSRLGRIAVERLAGPLDVFHFSDWMFPPQRSGVRATTIFDLIPLHFPDWVAPLTRRMHGRKYRHAAETCDVVFAISQFSANDISETLHLTRERVRVAYPGVDARYTPEGERHNLGPPYLLAVSTLEPRKNLPTLIEAFSLVRRSHPDLSLAVAGAQGWGERPDLDREGVVWLGYVPDAQLPALYRGAEAFVYGSLFEGFGMPILDAMACGTPVVSSAHPSLDEASGEVALRAEPRSAESFAAAIERAIAERGGLREAGRRHAARFTWRACAEALVAGYRAAV